MLKRQIKKFNSTEKFQAKIQIPNITVELKATIAEKIKSKSTGMYCMLFQIDILEPKMISASSVNYLSTTRHHLLHLDSLDMIGQIHIEPCFDELKLQPIRYMNFSCAAGVKFLVFVLQS